MEIDYLREYLVIADERNLTAAAKKLNTTQSTLSKHLSVLERTFGLELVKRSSRGIELTAAGYEVVRRSSLVLGAYDDMLDSMAAFKVRPVVTLAGLIDNHEVVSLITRAMKALRQKGESYSIECKRVESLFKSLVDGEIDFVVTHGPNQNAILKGMRKIPLLKIPFCAFVTEESDLGEVPVSLSDLRDCRFVRLTGEYVETGWQTIHDACVRHGFEPKYISREALSTLDFLSADIGDAVIILPKGFLRPYEMSMAGLRQIDIVDQDAFFTINLYYRDKDEEILESYIDAFEEASEAAQRAMDEEDKKIGWGVFERNCEQLSRRAKLNKVEAATLASFVRGRSLDRMAQDLGLTRMIVGDLVVSIYRKLGVVSREELLDLVEAGAERPVIERASDERA
ncbi:MAG: LysR family transcriptional regulator [Eggerthellaceae bacterium]|nr:LysR family transcriptional regulator [Eggerthellaceae bacterium]